jgi:hypothetical protein
VLDNERRLRILSLIGTDGPEFPTKRLCGVCAEITQMTGAGIMLMSGDGPRGSVCTSNEVSAAIEQLQFTLGEGPSIDTYDQDRPVAEPHLAHTRTPRWLAFTGPALEAGAQALFGFPLHLGAVRLGSLNLYCDRPGALTDDQHADALVMADITAQAILVLQADAPPGQLAGALSASADFHYVVHQASGMVAAQLELSVRDALVRLRAYAFGHDRPLNEVARDVVGTKLRFDAASGEDDHRP